MTQINNFPQTEKSQTSLTLPSVKDPYLVLRQKEKDLERVRIELKALLIVAALLTDGDSAQPTRSSAPIEPVLLQEFRGNELEELALYYPFIQGLQNSPE